MRIINSNNYQIIIGQDILSKYDFSKYSKIGILTDENTKKLCLPIILKEIPKKFKPFIIQIKSGEENKNIETCTYIWKKMVEQKFDKHSVLINLGGGIIGDMGGFCAATFKRGIDFIQIPTTLLAMTDASIGGKLGVDFKNFKNTIGLIKNPKSVFIYPKFIETQKKEEVLFGFIEVIKHALINDIELWTHIKNTSFEELIWQDIIIKSIEIKNNIVLEDPKEKGLRKKLNFGHTFGHAIESFYLKKDTPIVHGQAIALGILLESKLSKLSEEERREITTYILSNFPLPNTPQKSELLPFLMNDKKNINESINFSLLDGIGNCSIDNLFHPDEL